MVAACRITSSRDAQVARVWTSFSVLMMLTGAVISWQFEDVVMKVAALLVPLLCLFMIHCAGMITTRYDRQTQIVMVSDSGPAYTVVPQYGHADKV